MKSISHKPEIGDMGRICTLEGSFFILTPCSLLWIQNLVKILAYREGRAQLGAGVDLLFM